ncbi:sensor histidine kinase [Streptomyces demainii]|uniref:histidine kinase n=1 Tax=Streptomyces demainii TaxID=588122 RepID=A0ABT9KYF6_9ACTN|nr:HAMP domain-containing sensor histidine kinase [Streptomyces demainii]MDP9613479.1 signal transduction histidine kinase [Streptomyces demainii]
MRKAPWARGARTPRADRVTAPWARRVKAPEADRPKTPWARRIKTPGADRVKTPWTGRVKAPSWPRRVAAPWARGARGPWARGRSKGCPPPGAPRGRRAWCTTWARIWEALRPFDPYRSVKAALGALVVGSVIITTLLVFAAMHSDTELRVITIFSIIASLLITQFVANGLTAPLDEMTDVTRAMANGDYTRRVRAAQRRDEFGDLASAFNRMAADLEAVDTHRKELVANVSHELRTPIAALRAVLENVVDGVSEADPETMRVALRQTQRLGRLVDQLLDLSRLDNGVVPLHARRFEVWPYLAGILKEASMAKGAESHSGAHTRKDVHLNLDVSPPELTAHADAERLHQVMANLIDNAVKHSPAHGRVTVRARRGDGSGSLELEVLDEGPGIPEAERHRVFERFNRGGLSPDGSADAGRRRPGPGSDGGTGLGLAIARWAVDLHGGRIRVAESPRGCRIKVSLPGPAPESKPAAP